MFALSQNFNLYIPGTRVLIVSMWGCSFPKTPCSNPVFSRHIHHLGKWKHCSQPALAITWDKLQKPKLDRKETSDKTQLHWSLLGIGYINKLPLFMKQFITY